MVNNFKLVYEFKEGKVRFEILNKENKVEDFEEFKIQFWRSSRTLKPLQKFLDEHKIKYDIIKLKLKLEEEFKKSQQKTRISLPKEIDKRSLEILRDKNILELYSTEFDKKIVHEEKARLIIFLFAIGRFLLNAEPTSFNLCVSDSSGTGKDYVTSKILEFFEEGEDKDYIKCEKITPEVLDSLSKRVDWNQKIFYNEDIRSNVLKGETLKVFSSGSKRFYTNKDGVAVVTEIKGKPVMIITTAKGTFSEEITRRFLNCALSSDIDQTKEIMKRWSKFKKDGIKPDYDSELIKALTFLKPIKVFIPYAEDLPDHFPSDHHIMRTQYSRFLDMVGASVVLHQYQRKLDSRGLYEATWKDYDVAVGMLKYLFKDSNQISLTKTDRTILEKLKKLGGRTRISSLESKTHLTPKTLRNRLMYLADFGLVEVDDMDEKEKRDNDIKKPTMVFTLKETNTENIPFSGDISKKTSNNNNINNINTFNNNNNNKND